jgi:hypothetical protein
MRFTGMFVQLSKPTSLPLANKGSSWDLSLYIHILSRPCSFQQLYLASGLSLYAFHCTLYGPSRETTNSPYLTPISSCLSLCPLVSTFQQLSQLPSSHSPRRRAVLLSPSDKQQRIRAVPPSQHHVTLRLPGQSLLPSKSTRILFKQNTEDHIANLTSVWHSIIDPYQPLFVLLPCPLAHSCVSSSLLLAYSISHLLMPICQPLFHSTLHLQPLPV